MRKRLAAMVLTGLVCLLAYCIGTGFLKNGSVYLREYAVSEDGRTLTVAVSVADSVGTVRRASVHRQEGGKLCLDFYSSFGGLNGSIGAGDTFTLPLEEDTAAVALYRSADCYETVLEKDGNGVWQRAD